MEEVAKGHILPLEKRLNFPEERNSLFNYSKIDGRKTIHCQKSSKDAILWAVFFKETSSKA